ncbi:MAG TPA: transglutaminase domain-containing protein, partial [Actinomycetes bacterium]
YDPATLDVFARGTDTTAGRNYDVVSRHPTLSVSELRNAGHPSADLDRQYTALPATLPAQVKTTELAIVRGLTNDYDKAYAIQQFFLDPRNGFTYTTNIPDFTGSALVAFLNNRKGFCQQYATMYAIMARLAGLPTRVDVGFTHGTEKTPGNWAVTRQNAHAWPEVYFSGVGWVRFEPTPGPNGVQAPTYALPPAGSTTNGPGAVLPPVTTRGEHNGQRTDLDPGAGTTTTKAKTAAAPVSQQHWAAVAGSIAVLVLLAAPTVARWIRRRRRLRPARSQGLPSVRVLEAWRELVDTGRDLGLPWAASRTPRRTAEALVAYGVRGDAAVAVRRLARSVERVRYARADVDVLGGHDPGADARLVVRGMEAASARKVRWRARLLPASVLSVVGGWLADVMDWVDGLGARMRTQLGRLLPSPTR